MKLNINWFKKMWKRKEKEISLFTKNYRVMVIPLVFFLYLFSHYLMNPYDSEWFIELTDDFWKETLFLLVYSIAITEVSLWLSTVLNKWIPWDKSAIKRVIVQVLLLIGLTFIIFFIVNLLYVLLIPNASHEIIDLETKIDLWQSLVISINMGIMISAIHTGYFLISNWKKSMMDAGELRLRAEKLERIASQAELESLKMQLDPHFLFNNFSTLSELVIEDQKIAVKFIDNLASVYRYMLSNVRKDVVGILDEVRFVESYFFLIQERMGTKVQLDIQLVEEYYSTCTVAPLALQLLVENAVKHNKASKETPLYIVISIVDNYLQVCNNKQRLMVELPSSKVGLNNIIERYRLLSDQKVEIIDTEAFFIVKLPLLSSISNGTKK